MSSPHPDQQSPLQTLQRLLHYAQSQNYAGYSKHDGLLSAPLQALLGWSRPTRLAAIQLVTRSPINLRPLLAIAHARNPKGIGLFATALLQHYRLSADPAHLTQAQELLQWLMDNRSPGFEDMCWGYHYPWQDVGFFAPAHFPNRVVSCWIGFAFALAWELTGSEQYLAVCKSVCRFLLNAPNRIADTPTELCLSYVPDPRVNWAVMDVSALVARMLVLTATATGESALMNSAHRCMNWVVQRQTDYGAWYYTHPPKASHITHDNYHSGIILDCLEEYQRRSGEQQWRAVYERGLEFYAHNLFLPNGAPRWMSTQSWPHDIHGAAQGIISFSRASRHYPHYAPLAQRVLEWTMEHLYNHADGSFFYQKGRYLTKRFTLMRWCNGWMAVALSELLLAQKQWDER